MGSRVNGSMWPAAETWNVHSTLVLSLLCLSSLLRSIKIHSEVADDTFLITLEKFRILCLVYNEDFLFPWEALSYEGNLEFVEK